MQLMMNDSQGIIVLSQYMYCLESFCSLFSSMSKLDKSQHTVYSRTRRHQGRGITFSRHHDYQKKRHTDSSQMFTESQPTQTVISISILTTLCAIKDLWLTPCYVGQGVIIPSFQDLGKREDDYRKFMGVRAYNVLYLLSISHVKTFNYFLTDESFYNNVWFNYYCYHCHALPRQPPGQKRPFWPLGREFFKQYVPSIGGGASQNTYLHRDVHVWGDTMARTRWTVLPADLSNLLNLSKLKYLF